MSRESKGIVFILLACFCYSLRSAFVKLSVEASPEMIVFFRLIVSSMILSPIFWKNRVHFKTNKLSMHFIRAIATLLSVYCSIYGIKELSLVDATLLENTFPLFIPLIWWFWQGKKIKKQSILALLIGFCGLFLILKPELNVLYWGSVASLSSGFLAAFSSACVKELSKTERTITTLFYFYLISTCASVFPLSTNFHFLEDSITWMYLIILGVLGPLFQFFMTKAYSLGSPHVIGGFTYSIVLLSVFWGWLIWGETLDLMTIIGTGILISSGIYLFLNEKTPIEERESVSL